VRIKWPNDLQTADGRKLGGILAEMELDGSALGWVVIGVGINITQAPMGACLAEIGPPPAVTDLAGAITRGVLAMTSQLQRDASVVLDRWRSRSATLGHRVRVGDVTGVALDIGDDGALLVRTALGIRRVLTGDVEMVVTRGADG
jgi:BirA family biotin operon repressor/biotin-[acetyl-CoA-carboxylase] ligase